MLKDDIVLCAHQGDVYVAAAMTPEQFAKMPGRVDASETATEHNNLH